MIKSFAMYLNNLKLSLDSSDDLVKFFVLKSIYQLKYLCFGKNSRSQKIYIVKKILKRDGSWRTLSCPISTLKRAQKHALYHIIPYGLSKVLNLNCCGFTIGKSIQDNAVLHIGKKIILKLDLRDFFPSISQSRVYGMFKNTFGYNHEISSYLSGLCTFNNELPQGAPTSPAISNIIASNLDKRIVGYLGAIDKDISYSRYADDITIGFNKRLNFDGLIAYLSNLVEEEGFFLNYDKIRLISNAQCMKVTGVIINSNKTTLGRKYYKNIRAILYSIDTKGWIESKSRYIEKKGIDNISNNSFKSIIKGHISYIYMINPEMGSKLLEKRNYLREKYKNED